ncbi:MAG TPA: Gfo/Idh/MocA family oxidoreductase [Planctomycetota bacterium]|jgi:predicted dehydrogenase
MRMDLIARRDFVKTVGYAGLAMTAVGQFAARAEDAKKTTLALVGCAHIHTPLFCDILSSRPDVTVKYVWDATPAKAEKVAPDLKAKVAKDPAEIFGDSSVQCAVILSETARHLELATAAAAAKKHLFVEKPLAGNSKDATAIADAVEKAGVLFNMGYHLRAIPQINFVKEHIAKGSFGKITRVHTAFCHGGLLEGMFDTDYKWVLDPKQAGVGGFGDVATHSVDLLMWLLGDVEAVSADIRNVSGKYPDVDEVGEALCKMKSGVTACVAGACVEPTNPYKLLVVGTEGHAMIFIEDRLYIKSKKIEGADGMRPWGKLPPGPPHSVVQLIEAINGKQMPLVTVREAAKDVKVLEAIYQAAREKKWVTL